MTGMEKKAFVQLLHSQGEILLSKSMSSPLFLLRTCRKCWREICRIKLSQLFSKLLQIPPRIFNKFPNSPNTVEKNFNCILSIYPYSKYQFSKKIGNRRLYLYPCTLCVCGFETRGGLKSNSNSIPQSILLHFVSFGSVQTVMIEFTVAKKKRN